MVCINDTRSEQASDCQLGLYICPFRPADNSTAQLSLQLNMTEMWKVTQRPIDLSLKVFGESAEFDRTRIYITPSQWVYSWTTTRYETEYPSNRLNCFTMQKSTHELLVLSQQNSIRNMVCSRNLPKTGKSPLTNVVSRFKDWKFWDYLWGLHTVRSNLTKIQIGNGLHVFILHPDVHGNSQTIKFCITNTLLEDHLPL